MKRIIIKVYGSVQGVFFRYTTRKVARKIGLTGFVKNLADGSVYIEAEGTESELNKLLEFAKKGPKYAEVENIKYEFKEAQNRYKGFDYFV
jgi:acylphosphatase